MNAITKSLIGADKISDYVPFISTVTNLADLCLKYAFIPRKEATVSLSNRYFTYLQDKSALRCAALLVPVLGNIVVALYDCSLRVHKYRIDKMAAELLERKAAASESCKSCKEAVLVAVKQNGLILEFVNKSLQNDREVVTAAIEQNVLAFQFASATLRGSYDSDRDLVPRVLAKDGLLLRFVAGLARKRRDAAEIAVTQNGLAFQLLSECLQKDLFSTAVSNNPFVLQFASEALQRAQPDIVWSAVLKDKRVLQFVPKEMQENFRERLFDLQVRDIAELPDDTPADIVRVSDPRSYARIRRAEAEVETLSTLISLLGTAL